MHYSRSASYRIKTVSNLFGRYIESRIQMEVDAPTLMHGRIIGYLYHHPEEEICQRDVEREFQIRRSTVTGILKLMEKRGLIIREPVSHDARLKKLTLTDEAVRWQLRFISKIEAMEQELLEGISPEDLDRFLHTLEQMQKNMERVQPGL